MCLNRRYKVSKHKAGDPVSTLPNLEVEGPLQQEQEQECGPGSLHSTRPNFNSTGVGFPADGSTGRVGVFGAFGSSSSSSSSSSSAAAAEAAPLFPVDGGDGYVQLSAMPGGLDAGDGDGDGDSADGGGGASKGRQQGQQTATLDVPGICEAAMSCPVKQQQALDGLDLLEQLRLLMVVPAAEKKDKRKSNGQTTVTYSAHAVFAPQGSVEAAKLLLDGCSAGAAAGGLEGWNPLNYSKLGPGFSSVFAAQLKACQQPGSQQLMVAKFSVRYMLRTGANGEQLQLRCTRDTRAMKVAVEDSELRQWEQASASQRKQAVLLLVAAAAAVALRAHPGAPPGLPLYDIQPQAREPKPANDAYMTSAAWQLQNMPAN
jgi:hypothetical protein